MSQCKTSYPLGQFYNLINLIEQNRNYHHFMKVGVDGMILQNYGCFIISYLRHELCSFEVAKTLVNEKNVEVLLKCLNPLRCKYKLNSSVFNS